MRLTVEVGFSDFDRIKLNGRKRIKLDTSEHPISHIRNPDDSKNKRIDGYQYIECTIATDDLYEMAAASTRGDCWTGVELHDCKEVK